MDATLYHSSLLLSFFVSFVYFVVDIFGRPSGEEGTTKNTEYTKD